MSSAAQAAEATLDMGKDGKQVLLTEEGIGSELLPSIFAFDAWGQPLGYGIHADPGGTGTFEALMNATAVMRKAWGCETVVYLVEGYTAPSGSDDQRSLQLRFPTDKDVHECLTAQAVCADGSVAHAVQPYTLGSGRRVNWLGREMILRDDDDESPTLFVDVAMDVLTSTLYDPEVMTYEDGFVALSELGFIAIVA